MNVDSDEGSSDQIGVIVVTLCMVASLGALTLWFATETVADVASTRGGTGASYQQADLN